MTAPTQLLNSEQELQQIVQRLREAYTPDQIVLFGSYAYGRPDRDSDFDLLIVKETDETPRERRFHVRKLLWSLAVATPIEPLVLTQGEIEDRLKVKDQFIQEIMTKGRRLYG